MSNSDAIIKECARILKCRPEEVVERIREHLKATDKLRDEISAALLRADTGWVSKIIKTKRENG